MPVRVLAASAFCVAAVCQVSSAAAASLLLSGSLSGSYGDLSTPGGDSSIWGGVGRANLAILDPGPNIQVNLADAEFNFPKSSTISNTNLWGYGGDVYWRDYAGAFGASVATLRFPDSHTSQSLSYGLFGEAYFFRSITLRLKGGAVTNNVSAYYGDAGIAVYPVRNIALDADVDYAKIQHGGPELRDVKVSAEYLPVPKIPVSVNVGYTYEKLSQISGHVNVFSAGITVYFGGEGVDGSLRDRQRNGPITWDGTPASLIGLGL
jgi:hypothetical protein